jgi:hypothetical protein
MKPQTFSFALFRRQCRFILSALLAALLATTGSAAVILVPADQPTIVAAIGAASAGDEIVIEAGTYNETEWLFINKTVTLRATNGLVVVRSPSGKDAVVEVAPGVTGVVFEGIHFERPSAHASWTRAVQVQGGAAATFQNCVFTGPANAVGLILFYGGDATLQGCTFSNFAAEGWASAIALEARDGTSPYSDVVVRDSVFGSGCNSWIRGFSWNPPKVGELTVSNCTFKAALGAHGIAFYYGPGPSNNTQYDPTKTLRFEDCSFEGTIHEIMEFHYTSLGAPAGLQFRRCHFKPYNSTRKMFWLDIPAPILFENCLFGGGKHETIMTVWGGPPSVDFHHCTMINQGITAAESASGQNLSSFIWGWDGGRTFNVVNSLFYCPTNYSAAFSGDPGSSADRTYAVTHTVVDHPWVVGPKVQVVLGTGGYTNVSLAGAFVDPAEGDYHLVNGTPWVNGGTDLGYGWDLDRAARNQGGAPDLGAYEFPVAPVMPTVSIGRSGENVVVNFTGVLQTADHVTGPFQDVPAAPNPLVLLPTDTARYWRARTP